MSSDNMEAKDKEALESSSCEIDRQIAADDDQIELSGLLRISSHSTFVLPIVTFSSDSVIHGLMCV